MNLPLLPGCWGFSFALGLGEVLLTASPALCSCCLSAYRLPVVHLTLDVGYLLIATQASCSHHSSTSRGCCPLATVAHGVPRQSSALGPWKEEAEHSGLHMKAVGMQARGGRVFSWLAVALGVGSGGCKLKEDHPKRPWEASQSPRCQGDFPFAVVSGGIWPWSTERNRKKDNRVLPRDMHRSQQTPSSNNTRWVSTHGHSQMVNTKIKLIMFFAEKEGEDLYSQQNQDWELMVAQTRHSLLPNSDLNWRK